jgi:hypothetical protein
MVTGCDEHVTPTSILLKVIVVVTRYVSRRQTNACVLISKVLKYIIYMADTPNVIAH